MSRYMNPRYDALEAYTPGEQPRDMVYIKLNTNESPFPPAPSVVAAMTAEQVENLRLYSDPTGKALKEKLAGLYGVAAGIQVMEDAPGYQRVRIAPHPTDKLDWLEASVQTRRGLISVRWSKTFEPDQADAVWRVAIETPVEAELTLGSEVKLLQPGRHVVFC